MVIAPWALASLDNWGYTTYTNPYYTTQLVVDNPGVVVQEPIVYDYSQPIDTTVAIRTPARNSRASFS